MRRARETGFNEAYKLGLGTPIALSAEHGQGTDKLYTQLRDAIAAHAMPTQLPKRIGQMKRMWHLIRKRRLKTTRASAACHFGTPECGEIDPDK